MNPRFSILVPTYNREELIGETIDSVLSQTCSNYELIVIDDGSTDRTLAVLAAYGGRIKVLRQSNQGPEAARRLGATVATGEYFVLLDSDDLLLPWALAAYERIIRGCEMPGLIIGMLEYFRGSRKVPVAATCADVLQVLKFRDYLSKTVPVGLSSSSIVVRKSVFEQSGAMRDTSKTFPLDTFHYILMFGTFGPCVIVRSPSTVAYRLHQGNVVNNVAGMLNGFRALLATERQEIYPGGRRRWFNRQACVGGLAWNWVVAGIRCGSGGLALRTFINVSPMVMAGVMRKIWLLLHEATPVTYLLEKMTDI